MNTWMEVRKKIVSKKLKSKTWLSDQKNLMKIIESAETAHLSSSYAERASISNLRTIIKAAKKALVEDDYNHLSNLFELAAELSTGDLRLKLGSKQRDLVIYEVSKRSDTVYYKLLLRSDQFERVKESTKQYFQYKNINQLQEKNG